MTLRDEMSDTSKVGPPEDRASVTYEVPMTPATLADEAWFDASAGRPTVGTASDYADVTGPLHRDAYENRIGPNSPEG